MIINIVIYLFILLKLHQSECGGVVLALRGLSVLNAGQ